MPNFTPHIYPGVRGGVVGWGVGGVRVGGVRGVGVGGVRVGGGVGVGGGIQVSLWFLKNGRSRVFFFINHLIFLCIHGFLAVTNKFQRSLIPTEHYTIKIRCILLTFTILIRWQLTITRECHLLCFPNQFPSPRKLIQIAHLLHASNISWNHKSVATCFEFA